MCSVSLLPLEDGCRIVCNRDERRARPTARPPSHHWAGKRQAIWPVDPEGGGTWIGANDAGVAMVLLNRAPRRRWPTRPPLLSRGCIIPRLLRWSRLATIVEHARNLEPDFAPFTLLAVARGKVAVVRNGSRGVSVRVLELAGPRLFTSSSLGDHLVEGPRQALFGRIVRRSPDRLAAQMRFHRHVWHARPEISVYMSRSDAATVSRSQIDLTSTSVRLEYEPLIVPHGTRRYGTSFASLQLSARAGKDRQP